MLNSIFEIQTEKKNLNNLSKIIAEFANIPPLEFDIGSYLATRIV